MPHWLNNFAMLLGYFLLLCMLLMVVVAMSRAVRDCVQAVRGYMTLRKILQQAGVGNCTPRKGTLIDVYCYQQPQHHNCPCRLDWVQDGAVLTDKENAELLRDVMQRRESDG